MIHCGRSYGDIFYVQAKLHSSTMHFKRTSKAEDALCVLWDPENEPRKVKLLVSMLDDILGLASY